MKVIKMMSGEIYPISEELYSQIISKAKHGQEIGWVAVPNIGLVNLKSAETIGEPPLKAFIDQYELDPSERFFMREGQRIYLEAHNYKEIKYKPDPRITRRYGNPDESPALPEPGAPRKAGLLQEGV